VGNPAARGCCSLLPPTLPSLFPLLSFPCPSPCQLPVLQFQKQPAPCLLSPMVLPLLSQVPLAPMCSKVTNASSTIVKNYKLLPPPSSMHSVCLTSPWGMACGALS
jgi:hypothetical protein